MSQEVGLLNVTRLLCGTPAPGDDLRYGEQGASRRTGHPNRVHQRPVVVWNVTARCNLRCVHCYTASTEFPALNELTTSEGVGLIEDLAQFGVPVVLFSGGEPLRRDDIFYLMAHAVTLGLQPVLSTNGTLLGGRRIELLRSIGVDRVGISIDGLEATNDKFRGVDGAFQMALNGIRSALEAGFRVSLRFTITNYNVADLDSIFDLVEREGIPRLCIYHLAYAGRGRRLLPSDLDHAQRRRALEQIFQRTLELHHRGVNVEVLTVDNHADGPFLLMWAQEHAPERTAEIQRLLKANGGNSTGIGIGCVDERGNIHPDQFWRTRTLGNIRERPFSQVWQDEGVPLLHQLRERGSFLPQRCCNCRFLSQCNGNLRARAEAATGNPWGEDPACYLTEQEISQGALVASPAF